MGKKKNIKLSCEICKEENEKILDKHHICERIELNSNNHEMNLCVICKNCHGKIHLTKEIEIIGLFPSTEPPLGRTLVYKINGVSNFPGLEEPYYKPENKKTKL